MTILPAPRRPALSLFLALGAAVLMGCGITLSEGDGETEFFKELTVEGEFVPNGELMMGMNYAQPYSTALEVQCDLLSLAKPTPTPKPPGGGADRPDPTATEVRIPAIEPTPANRLSVLLTSTIGPNIEGSTADEATPVLGSLSRRFRAPADPGSYAVRCYTPADENNAIAETFRIEAD